METETSSYEAAFNYADAVIRYCLPQWVPSLGLILCTITMATSFLFKLTKTLASGAPR